MKIQFFQFNRELDSRAINGGVYLIELLKDSNENSIRLYIGESGYMVKRCGEHLYELFKDADYFGLLPEDLERNDLILRFSVLESIKKKRKGKRDLYYEDIEKKYISAMKPLTQKLDDDNQIDRYERVKVIQAEMEQLGFKLKPSL